MNEKKKVLLKRPQRIRTIDGEEMRLRGYYALVRTKDLRYMKEKADERPEHWKTKTLKEYLRYIGALQ